MKISRIIFALTFLSFLSACGPISQTVKEDRILVNLDELEKIENDDKTLIYKRPGYNIGRFNKFRVDPVRMKSTNKQMTKMSARDKRKLKNYLRTAVQKELRKGGYEVTETNSSGVVGIQFTLMDVDPGNPYLNILQFHAAGIALDIGGVTIQSVFYDTSSNQVNGVAVIGAEGARKFSISSVMGQWGDVKNIIDKWAEGFRKHVDEEHEALAKK